MAGIRSIDPSIGVGHCPTAPRGFASLADGITRIIIRQLWGDAACCCCCLAMLLCPFLWLVARPLGGFSPLARSNPTAALRAAGQSIDGTPGRRPQATARAQRPHKACGVHALLGGWRSRRDGGIDTRAGSSRNETSAGPNSIMPAGMGRTTHRTFEIEGLVLQCWWMAAVAPWIIDGSEPAAAGVCMTLRLGTY